MSFIYGSATGANVIEGKNNIGVAFATAEAGGVWYNTLEVEDQTANSIASGANKYRGECAITASSTMIGKKITVAIVPMKIGAGTLTGNVTFGIYNSSGVLQELTGTVAANTITASKANYPFTSETAGAYAIQEGDFIMAGYTTEGGGLIVNVYGTDSNEYDGVNSGRAYWESGSMHSVTTTDFVMSLSDE